MSFFQGKTALIAGGAGAIGSELAGKLERLDCDIYIADIDYVKAGRIASTFKNASAIKLDAMSPEECETVSKTIVEQKGSIDILINCISKRIWATAEDLSAQEWTSTFYENFSPFINLSRAVSRYMKQNNSGSIIDINSKAGKWGAYGESACSTAMAGRRGAVRALAVELSQWNIRVNAICVGDMPQNESWQKAMSMKKGADLEQMKEQAKSKYLHSACTADDIWRLVEFLLSDESRFMIGQSLNLTGGQLLY